VLPNAPQPDVEETVEDKKLKGFTLQALNGILSLLQGQ